MTWLGFLNFLVLQWFGIRLARLVENDRQVGWKLIKWIVPLTGWWNNYRYIGLST